MKTIIVIQHCQSEHHINEMSGGWTDTPLTELGRKQATSIAQRLENEIESREFAMYSSDLKRAYQTAEIISKKLKLDIIVDPDLREINTGIAAGKTKQWANEHRKPRDSRNFDLDYQEFEKGETWRQFYHRVQGCMEKIFASENKKMIIVTHGGTLARIVGWWLGLDEQQMSKVYFGGSPASLSVLKESQLFDQNVLNSFNDRSHLQNL